MSEETYQAELKKARAIAGRMQQASGRAEAQVARLTTCLGWMDGRTCKEQCRTYENLCRHCQNADELEAER